MPPKTKRSKAEKDTTSSSHEGSIETTISVGSDVPEGVVVDILASSDGNTCNVDYTQDFGTVLKGLKKAIVFAVPVSFFIRTFCVFHSLIR